MASCGMSCVKYLVFFFNFLFAITGLIVLTTGAIIQSSYHHYSNFLGDNFWTAPIVLIVIGAIVFIVAFFGCCGAAKESSCMILTFSIFLILIFLAEVGIGVAGYLKHRELKGILTKGFNNTLADYEHNIEAQRAWNLVQTEMECCGVNSADDWEPIFKNDTLPASCCVEYAVDTKKCTKANASKEGCLPKLLNFLDTKSLILAGVGVGVAAIQLLGVVFACCLSKSFRANYETV
uniref:Tetraspanin n=1 Tax=Corethrella appendiculata TaxID=1370023 RepID=U5EVW1_9DIPT